MKKLLVFVLLVLTLIVSGCGNLEQAPTPNPEEITTLADNTNPPPPPPPPPPPVECCGKVKTFRLVAGTYVSLAGATNVPVTATVVVGFSEAQTPSNVRITLSPSAACSWVWSAGKTYATCIGSGITGSLRGYLAYSTPYTIKVEKRVCSWICYWSTQLTTSFSTEQPLVYR
jgi:Bacterial Ig-like domain